MSLSNYLEDMILSWIGGTNFATAPTNLFFSLHSDNPADTGANEVTATYTAGRDSYTASGFTAPATVGTNRQIKNTALIDWGNSTSAGSASWIGIWDASTSGNFLFGFQLLNSSGVATPLTFGSGDPVTIAINGAAINLSISSFSIYLVDMILNWFKGTTAASAPSTIYAGLFTSLVASGTGTEVTTDIRVAGRVAITAWGSLTTEGTKRVIKNTTAVDFGNSANTVLGVYILGLWSAVTAGNLYVFLAVTPRDVLAGEPYPIPANGGITLKAS